MTDSVDLERSLETQRVRLLRLLAGWIAVLGVLSFGPVAIPSPRWVRAFFDRLLIRAELAAQFLVRATALTQATSGLVATAPLEIARDPQAFEVPSAQALFARIEALRDILENLPRTARRSLRARNLVGAAIDFSAPPCCAPAPGQLATVGADWTPPRVERPPDKGEDRFGFLVGSVRAPSALQVGGVGG